MNKKRLRSEMALYGDTYLTLSGYLGVTPNTLSNKINGYKGSQFNQSEIVAIRERYDLTDSEVMQIFFDN